MKRNLDERLMGIAFADIMVSFAAYLFVLFILIAIQPHTKDTLQISMPGRLCAEIFWDNNRDIDLDLWGKSPIDAHATGYTNMHTRGLDLFKDVLGFQDNPEHINMEIMCANKIYPGEWDFNVQYYSNHEKVVSGNQSVKVTMFIRIFKGKDGTSRVLKAETTVLPAEEKTMFRFVVNENGDIETGTINSQQIFLRGK